jgi:hypothetical protein
MTKDQLSQADLDMTEVDSMGFIRSHTTIPLPKILNAYEKEGY